MANIKPYLDKIRLAIFGEEVRGSIIDAITAMNNESSQAKNEATTAEEQARASVTAAQASEQKAAQAAAHSAKIDKMTVSASKLNGGAIPTVTISDDGTKKHLTFGIPKGDKGDNGVTPNITFTVTTGAAGSNASVIKSGTAEAPKFALTVPRGNTGATPNITATVTTGAAGSNASVTKSGTNENPVLNFTIPRGNTGATPNLTIGTVSTGAAGTSATASITGTAENPVLNLTIPEGERGMVENVPLSDEPAKNLGNVASAGTSKEVARADHVHPAPTSIRGNAESATKLQTARAINLIGSITGSSDFDGSSDVNINTIPKYCCSGQNTEDIAETWFKFAKITIDRAFWDYSISFKVYTNYGHRDTNFGILHAHVRSDGSSKVESASLIWEIASDSIDLSNFVLAYDPDKTFSTIELFVKPVYRHGFFHFVVLSEGTRMKEEPKWTLINNEYNDDGSVIPDGFVQIQSTLSTLQNPISNYNVNEIGAVSFNAQTLTEAQKQQARANIGAGTLSTAPVTSVNGMTGNVDTIFCLSATRVTLDTSKTVSVSFVKSMLSARMVIIQPKRPGYNSTMILTGPFTDNNNYSAVSGAPSSDGMSFMNITFNFKENGTKMICSAIEGIYTDRAGGQAHYATMNIIEVYNIYAIY